MKKKNLIFGGLTVLGLATFPLAFAVSCGNKAKTHTETETTNESFAIAVSDPENPRWIKANNELINSFDAIKQGAFATISKKQEDQNAWLNTKIAAGSKGLIIGAVDAAAVANAVEEAHKKNAKVVAYDRLITGTDKYDWYTTYDNSKVGTAQGVFLIVNALKVEGVTDYFDGVTALAKVKEHLAKKPLDKVKYITSLAGDPGDNNAPLFYGGAKKFIDAVMALKETDGKLKWLRGDNENFDVAACVKWDYAKGQSKLTAEFTTENAKMKDLIGILSPNDGMAKASINAINANGQIKPEDIVITGQDYNDEAIKQIKNNTQKMTIYKPDTILSKVAVAILTTIVDPANKDKKPEEIFKIVEGKLDEKTKGIIQFDQTQYDSLKDEKNPNSGSHPINTIILKPIVVTKDNVENPEK